jgi:hypothetical protein
VNETARLRLGEVLFEKAIRALQVRIEKLLATKPVYKKEVIMNIPDCMKGTEEGWFCGECTDSQLEEVWNREKARSPKDWRMFFAAREELLRRGYEFGFVGDEEEGE